MVSRDSTRASASHRCFSSFIFLTRCGTKRHTNERNPSSALNAMRSSSLTRSQYSLNFRHCSSQLTTCFTPVGACAPARAFSSSAMYLSSERTRR